MNSYYVVDTRSVEDTCCEDIDLQKNSILNVTDSFSSLNISVESPKIDSAKYESSSRDSSQVSLEHVVVMKAYFMNKIHELNKEIRKWGEKFK